MTQQTLTEKEELFCRFYRETGNGKEAAVFAGYPARSARKTAQRLLADPRIRRKLSRPEHTGVDKQMERVTAGLYRLAFGSVNDAIRLAVLGKAIPEPELEQLDLFNLSELKVGEKGIELKFFDRQKALSQLQEWVAGAGDEKQSSFYEALEKGAATLRKEAGTAE